ncbi:MAG: DUF2182 domain-containing protein [bacterium]|nr:DUF2182 domain-containing protein [bacterium]
MVGAGRIGRLSPLIPATIAAAWVVAIVAQATGTGRVLHHDALIEGGLPLWAALVLFAAAWQAMIAAMMLPSSLPLVRLFATVAAANDAGRAGRAVAALLLGYGLVWTAFGMVAFLGDLVLHHLVDTTPWLAQHSWLIAGGTLTLAGAFQFSKLKDACLSKCRLPGMFLLQHYRRGIAAAFSLGRRHGLFCVGCCWALMLLMFAAGFANLWWMAALTALMVYEKAGAHGKRLVPFAGALLLLWGTLTIAHPLWLPAPLGGTSY